jgi:hypothetical protein
MDERCVVQGRRQIPATREIVERRDFGAFPPGGVCSASPTPANNARTAAESLCAFRIPREVCLCGGTTKMRFQPPRVACEEPRKH